jgi:hypothetical protein
MKIKSELYTHEIALLYRGIQLQLNECEKEVFQIRKKARISSILMFWRAGFIYFEAAMKGQAILKLAIQLKEIRDKLMESEGVDEDMQPITFEKMLEKRHMQN